MKLILATLLFLSVCLYGVSAQTTYPVITPQNAMQLVEIHRFTRSNVDEMRRGNFISHSDVAFSADGDAIFIAHGADIWRYPLTDLQEEALFLQTPELIIHMVVNPNGEQIATYHTDNILRTWDIATGAMLWDVSVTEVSRFSERIHAIAYQPDGTVIVLGDSQGDLLRWETQTGARRSHQRASLDMIGSLAFSPDGAWLAVGAWNDTTTIYQTDEYTPYDIFKRRIRGHAIEITDVVFSMDSTTFWTSGFQMLVHWDLDAHQRIATLDYTDWITSLAIHDDLLVAGTGDNYLLFVDTRTNDIIHTLQNADNGAWVYYVAFHPQGNLILTAAYDGVIRLWGILEA